jgi:hypothetical protein
MGRPRKITNTQQRDMSYAILRSEIQQTLLQDRAISIVWKKFQMLPWDSLSGNGLSPLLLCGAAGRIGAHHGTWNDYLMYLRVLPGMLMAQKLNPVHLDQIYGYVEWSWEYIVLFEWLRWMVPGDQSMPTDLFDTDKIMHKPRAEFSKSILDLCIELYPRSAVLQDEFSTPVEAWFVYEASILSEAIEASGILGSTPNPVSRHWSKDDSYLACREVASWMESADRLHPLPTPTETVPFNQALLSIAAATAATDDGFRLSKAYRGFHNQLRVYGRLIRKTPGGRFPVFSNGSLLPSGRNRHRKHRKIKGM